MRTVDRDKVARGGKDEDNVGAVDVLGAAAFLEIVDVCGTQSRRVEVRGARLRRTRRLAVGRGSGRRGAERRGASGAVQPRAHPTWEGRDGAKAAMGTWKEKRALTKEDAQLRDHLTQPLLDDAHLVLLPRQGEAGRGG